MTDTELLVKLLNVGCRAPGAYRLGATLPELVIASARVLDAEGHLEAPA